MEQLKTIFELILRFHNILVESNPYEPLGYDSMKELSLIESQFNGIHRFLYQMTKTMASKGNYPELFLRLDYNGFMETLITREKQGR